MSKVKVLAMVLIGFFLMGVSQVLGSEEQNKLIEGAKKEGKVVYWTSGLNPECSKAIEEGFKKRYGLHDFQVMYALTTSPEIITKVNQEIKAGRLTVDIISTTLPIFFYDLLKRGELMKYDSPEYKYFPQRKGLFVEPGYWVVSYAYFPVMMWNPKYVKKDIVTYTDLLRPEFKGMIVSMDPKSSEAYLYSYIGLRKILEKDFFIKLAQQNIMWFRRGPDILNRVTTGERPVCFIGNTRNAYNASQEGINIRVCYPKEGVVLMPNPFIILAKGPHPNAAKLLVDYLNSVEGQRILVEKASYFTAREGVNVLPKATEPIPPVAKINIIPMDWKSITEDDLEKARKELAEVFGI